MRQTHICTRRRIPSLGHRTRPPNPPTASPHLPLPHISCVCLARQREAAPQEVSGPAGGRQLLPEQGAHRRRALGRRRGHHRHPAQGDRCAAWLLPRNGLSEVVGKKKQIALGETARLVLEIFPDFGNLKVFKSFLTCVKLPSAHDAAHPPLATTRLR